MMCAFDFNSSDASFTRKQMQTNIQWGTQNISTDQKITETQECRPFHARQDENTLATTQDTLATTHNSQHQ